LGERAEAVRSNLLDEAWLGIRYHSDIELSQSQQNPVVFDDRNLMAIQGSQIQNLLEGFWVWVFFFFFVGGELWKGSLNTKKKPIFQKNKQTP